MSRRDVVPYSRAKAVRRSHRRDRQRYGTVASRSMHNRVVRNERPIQQLPYWGGNQAYRGWRNTAMLGYRGWEAANGRPVNPYEVGRRVYGYVQDRYDNKVEDHNKGRTNYQRIDRYIHNTPSPKSDRLGQLFDEITGTGTTTRTRVNESFTNNNMSLTRTTSQDDGCKISYVKISTGNKWLKSKNVVNHEKINNFVMESPEGSHIITYWVLANTAQVFGNGPVVVNPNLGEMSYTMEQLNPTGVQTQNSVGTTSAAPGAANAGGLYPPDIRANDCSIGVGLVTQQYDFVNDGANNGFLIMQWWECTTATQESPQNVFETALVNASQNIVSAQFAPATTSYGAFGREVIGVPDQNMSGTGGRKKWKVLKRLQILFAPGQNRRIKVALHMNKIFKRSVVTPAYVLGSTDQYYIFPKGSIACTLQWQGGIMNTVSPANNYTFGIAKLGMVVKQKFVLYYYETNNKARKYSTLQMGIPSNNAITNEDFYDVDNSAVQLNKTNS